VTDAGRSLVAVENLTVSRGRVEVLHDVGFSMQAGEIVALLGPNGAGKSTLLSAMGGMLKPGSGRIVCAGRVATVMQSAGLARRSARANVELAMAWWGVPRSQRRKRAMAALDLMQAAHLARRPARALSGGEQRRIHLARAVAVSPDLLLLDEPFDGLDPDTHRRLRHDTARALRDAGSAVIIVLHERSDAWAMADRVLVLIDGRIRADGAPQAVIDSPPSSDVARFLGYDGTLSTERGTLHTRPRHVRIAPDGDVAGTVIDSYAVEDGVRLHIRTERGDVWAAHDAFDVTDGDEVRLRIEGGVEFADS
jgi:ABC-type sulfate/molybdate transport systems ATPase subunit